MIFLVQRVKMSERKLSNVANRSLQVVSLVKWTPGVCVCLCLLSYVLRDGWAEGV